MFLFPKQYVRQARLKVKSILALADLPFDTYGSDGAYGNFKLVAHLQDVALGNVLASFASGDSMMNVHRLCLNHRNGLVEGSAATCVEPGLVSSMYSMVDILRMGGHFARLCIASDLSTFKIELIRGKPPKHLHNYNDEALDYLLSNYQAEQNAQSRQEGYRTEERGNNIKFASGIAFGLFLLGSIAATVTCLERMPW